MIRPRLTTVLLTPLVGITLALVAAIDDVAIPVDAARMRTVLDAYATVAWDVI